MPFISKTDRFVFRTYGPHNFQWIYTESCGDAGNKFKGNGGWCFCVHRVIGPLPNGYFSITPDTKDIGHYYYYDGYTTKEESDCDRWNYAKNEYFTYIVEKENVFSTHLELPRSSIITNYEDAWEKIAKMIFKRKKNDFTELSYQMDGNGEIYVLSFDVGNGLSEAFLVSFVTS